LAEVATTVQAEGWAWVETAPRSTASELYAFQRVRPKRRQPTRREAQAIVRLRRRIRVIDAALQAEDGVSDEAEAQALHDEGRKLSAELEAQEQALAEYSRKARGMAGVVVTVDGNGAALVHRGLVREADAEEAQADDGDRGGKAKKQKPAKANSGISAKLARTLSAHRTVAMQAELARQPGVALVAVVYPLALRSFYHERHAGVVQISGTPADRLERYAADLPESPAVAALIEARQAWRAKLPTEPEGLFAVLRELSQDELLSLLAVCVAGCIDAVTADTADQRTNALAGALDLDMAQWWTPTAAGFFNHVPKARIVEAIKSFAPKQAHQLAVVKKGELAATAERLAAGTGWLPDMLRKAA
jgi:ParB family chromosome partitioning protein